MKIYYAQRNYHQMNKTWATTLEPLGLANEPPPPGTQAPTLRATPEGYEAEIIRRTPEGKPLETWVIRQDSRLTRKP